MATVKTAIAIEKPLFEAADRLARKLKLSRSRLYSAALQKYLDDFSNRRLLATLNRAHARPADTDDLRMRTRALRLQQRLIDGEW
jgi:hypothetical protein